ncbi:TetR/AcrR family transcriptional regulator [Thermomonospora umbrina]|nr:TetR family transcriptional regulator [Thermomonospora umbrina]
MSRDAAGTTRDALLHAAREEFAAHGIAGARVDRIARRAGVNKERIYGHFGSKDKLFDTVMNVALDELAEALSQPGEDPVEYVGQLFDHYRAHPEVLRLLMWESLHQRDENLPHDQRRVDRCRAKVDSLASGLARETGPEMGRLMFTLIGLAAWPTAMPQIAQIMLGDLAGDPDDPAAMREHVTAFARAALEKADPR